MPGSHKRLEAEGRYSAVETEVTEYTGQRPPKRTTVDRTGKIYVFGEVRYVRFEKQGNNVVKIVVNTARGELHQHAADGQPIGLYRFMAADKDSELSHMTPGAAWGVFKKRP